MVILFLMRKGKVIGVVTSCAVDKEGFLTGQAYLELRSSAEGTPIFIFQGAPAQGSKAPAELKTGDRVTLPTPAVVVSRFPKLIKLHILIHDLRREFTKCKHRGITDMRRAHNG